MNSFQLYEKLFSAYGKQYWWSAGNAFEVCTGAILTQNTAWSNVEKAIENLKREKMLSCKALADSKLVKLVKPSG